MPLTRQKILLVDDDPAMLRLLTKWLETAGYETERAGDGRQAMSSIEASCPHILITDWEMPFVDGLALCRWLRVQKLPRYVYTIFLTVRNGLDDIIQGLDAGADDFLKKPIDRGELLARLKAGERLVDLEQRLSQMALSDSLTGLSTRRTFFDYLHREWHRANRQGMPLTCVMLDLDHFKRVNETHGHLLGDDVLRRIAAILRDNTRASDIVTRYSDEKFCVALPDSDEQQAAVWAERIRDLIATSDLTADGRPLGLTASFGIAQRLDDTLSPESLVEMAEQAMLVAKQSGRDRVIAYSSLCERTSSCRATHTEALMQQPAAAAMTPLIAALPVDETLGLAASHFLRHRVSSAPVVDLEGRLIGALSERDLVAVTQAPDWCALPIRQTMSANVVSYEETTPLATIHEFLDRVSIRSVVIVRDGRPVGVLSRSSLLRWIMSHSAADARTVEVSSPLEVAPLEVATPAFSQHADTQIAEQIAESPLESTGV